MKNLFIITIIFVSIFSFGQNTSDNPKEEQLKLEQMPEYRGGEGALNKFLQKHMRYPDKERANYITGRVVVKFIVNEDGSISDIGIKKGVSRGIDKEAIRVVRLLPKFKPGRDKGKAVSVAFILPIMFKLADSDGETLRDLSPLSSYRNLGDTYADCCKGLEYAADKNYSKAKAFFELAADKHYPPALYQLANIYLYGRSVSKDYTIAMRYMSEAADSGYSDAQLDKGYMHEKGWGAPADQVIAEKWYRKAADQNNRIAQCNLAYFYLNGYGGLRCNDTLAEQFYMKSAESGFARAESEVGFMYERGRGGLPRDTPMAYLWYRKAADQDYPYAMCRIGEYYLAGLVGLPKKDSLGISRISKAADLGNSYAQFRLAYLYQQGKSGLEKDTDKALKWYELSAEQGNNDSRNNYAWLCYLRKTNIPKAIEYVKLSLDQAPNNMNRLDTYGSLLFLKGDYAEAEKWQKKAIDAGGDKKGGYLERYGNIQMKLGNKEEAMKYWKMAQDLDGHSDKLADKIAKGEYLE